MNHQLFIINPRDKDAFQEKAQNLLDLLNKGGSVVACTAGADQNFLFIVKEA